MQRLNGRVLLSASDLVAFLECEHATTLALADLVTPLARAPDDESALLVQGKGFAHEARYLASLQAQGLRIVTISGNGPPDALAQATRQAMRDGPDVIFQAALLADPLYGRADFLRRVERPSRLGPYSYEVIDTKLARSAKAKFIIQLCFYSELLASEQGLEPRAMHVVLGNGVETTFRVADYSRYFRQVRERLVDFAAREARDTYPQRCAHCELCPWRQICQDRWSADDHLNQVAGISVHQIERLDAAGIATLAALATRECEPPVAKLHPETVARLRAQAALQLADRQAGRPAFEFLPAPPDAGRGLGRLPEPDAGDVFFDMEGDPFEPDGLEYLFGVRFVDDGVARFVPFWAHDRAQERRAFEGLIDFLVDRIRRFPRMHVYHYAHYEPTALKRLMSHHGTREADVDALLRDGRLVDLYRVVREALRASRGYSLKDLECFYRVARDGAIKDAGASIVHYERWRDSGDDAMLEHIRRYNEDDCRSTHALRDWLVANRSAGLPWAVRRQPADTDRAARQAGRIEAIEAALAAYRARLIAPSTDRGGWGSDEHERELVFQLLDFHRRAAKPGYWAMYARQEMTEAELIDDADCLGALRPVRARPPEKVARSLVHTFEFPAQETKLRAGHSCTDVSTTKDLGEIVELDLDARIARIKISASKEFALPLSVGPGWPVDTEALRLALYRFADSVIADDGRFRAVRALLRREIPVLRGRERGSPIGDVRGDALEQALAAALALDHSYLFIQGPPGAGKTRTGSRLIVELLRRGKRVGVTSHSHHAIHNLLREVEACARAQRFALSGVKKMTARDAETRFDGQCIRNVDTNEKAIDSDAPLIAGTAWLFADPALEQALDYLFVDEAGQVALANLSAMGLSARNIVLLGDQMQLGQPIQGVHPGHSGQSTLDYLLDGQATVPPDRGIFLATTWRMHEDVCRFISDAVYEGRLDPEPATARRRLILDRAAHPALAATGIRFVAVEHDGCSQRSEPEAAVVAALFASLQAQACIDDDGEPRPMRPDDILVVAPYNAQVNLLRSTLPAGARVGTIDKFQGQQAQAVIVSMTTSNGERLPRNIEFLYDKNRLNVAVSRAQCLAVVVASPDLMRIRCTTPQQIGLVNTLCWLREYAQATIDASPAATPPAT